MIKLPIFILCLFLVQSALAYTSEIRIGCTTKCSLFYKHALKRAAKHFDVKLEILDLSQVENPLENVDGILIPGGADINPKYYLSEVEPDLQDYTRKLDHLVNYSKEGERRDPFEYGLLKQYFKNESLKTLPVLGICRGMQMLSVSQGIPLWVDIKTELGIRNRRYIYDRIWLEEEQHSLLNSLFSESTFLGFKQHHQGIRVPYFEQHRDRWPHLKITAYSNKGRIAESLEFTNRPVLGVQFHPEKDFGHERKSIFGWLISSAITRKKLAND